MPAVIDKLGAAALERLPARQKDVTPALLAELHQEILQGLVTASDTQTLEPYRTDYVGGAARPPLPKDVEVVAHSAGVNIYIAYYEDRRHHRRAYRKTY